MDLQDRLAELLETYESELPEYSWAQEGRRWQEGRQTHPIRKPPPITKTTKAVRRIMDDIIRVLAMRRSAHPVKHRITASPTGRPPRRNSHL